MSKNMPQIALDFGPEPSPPPQQGDSGEKADHLARQYMAAGVGVRIKSLKSPKAVSGDLFGNGEEQPVEPPQAENGAVPVAEAPLNEEGPEAENGASGAPVLLAEPAEMPVEGMPGEHILAAEVLEEEVLAEAVLAETALVEAVREENGTIPAPRRPKRVARVVTGTAAPKAVKSKRGRKSLKQVSAEADLIEIPADETLFSKQYYTMGEVAEMFRVNQSLLRFWETEFDILQPRKNKKGDRYFRPVDIKNLHLIYHLLRQRKYTIEGAKDFLKKNKKAEERFEAIQRLQEIRAFLQEWKAHINF
jgi:DNA-binding transcriptional MerR regulator